MKFLFKTIFWLILLLALILAVFRTASWWREDKNVAQIAPANGKLIATDEGYIHVSTWGETNAKPIVMTHGMAAWGGLWERTAIALSTNGYRVIALDQPPFGFSQRDDQDFSRSNQAKKLGALVKALDLKDYVLVGHSYGGGVAMESAMRFPDELAALVLICPVMVLGKEGEAVTKGSAPFPLSNGFLGETLVSATITNPLMTGFLTKRFMHLKDNLTDRHIEILQAPMKLKGNTSNMVTWLQQFLAGDPNSISRDRAKLKAFAKPVSLIWGEEDTVTPIAQGVELNGLLKPQRFEQIDNIGHMPQLEDPKRFNKLLLDVLGGF